MSSLGKILLLGGGAALAAYALAVPRVSRQLTARTVKLNLGKVSIEGNRLRVALIILNPTSDNIAIRSVVGDVFVNGKKVGVVESFENTNVLPNAKTTLYLTVRVLAVRAIQAYLNFMEKDIKKGFVKFALTGAININNRVTPFQFTDRIEWPTLKMS